MCDEWMPHLELPLSWEQFHQLPRNAAFKYEYLEGKALLTPRAKHYHALLDLHAYHSSGQGPPEDVRLRSMVVDDFLPLEVPFKAAFHRIQPFGSLDDAMQREAAHQCLQRTRAGGDGPWIQEASFVAANPESEHCGAILTTLLPSGNPDERDSYYWPEPPPPEYLAQRRGRPHLTWIFVTPRSGGCNVGTALLSAAVQALMAMGYRQLATTFILGNEASMLWHWRNGFQLLPHPASLRRVRERYRKQQIED
jgi:GNAT superfamily N-acetyltransferase